MGNLGEFEQLILFALVRLGDDAYGVTIRAEIEDETGRTVSSGAIYTALKRLEERGFVTSRDGGAETGRVGRPRKYYALEPTGARALMDTYTRVTGMANGCIPALARLAE